MIVQPPSLLVLRKSHPRYIEGGFLVMTPMVVDWHYKRVQVIVPPGFVTNLASIPQALQWAFPVNANHRLAAVLHDYLYHCAGELESGVRYTRHDADVFFYKVMQLEGVAAWRSRMMFCAVDKFGGSAWRYE